MKIKYTILIFIIGLFCVFIGALFKILHYNYSNDFLITGMILQVTGGLLFVWKMLNSPRAKSILNEK
ncbi:MAG: hypothetical protein KF829_05350 [Ferruginibacter sp.]|nr:hypothetical protein [Ferruginibacter sp.]